MVWHVYTPSLFINAFKCDDLFAERVMSSMIDCTCAIRKRVCNF